MLLWHGRHLFSEGWLIALHHQPAHTAHQSGFPSHFLQLLNVNIIFCEDSPAEPFTLHCLNTEQGWYCRNQMQLFLLQTVHLHTRVRKRQENSLKTNLCSSCGAGQNFLQGLVRFWIQLPLTEMTNFPSGSHGNPSFPTCLSHYSLLTHVRLKREHVGTHYCIFPSSP